MDRALSFQAEALPHLEAVYRFALRLSGSNDDAEDLVQETYLRAYRGWHLYTPGTKAKSWLFTICRNAFLRQRQNDARRREVMQLAAASRSAGSGARWDDPLFVQGYDRDPARDYFDSFIDSEVLRLVDELPDDFREAVVLCDLEGLSYAEAGETMGVPLGTVKSRLYRGRRRLQVGLRDYVRETAWVRETAA